MNHCSNLLPASPLKAMGLPGDPSTGGFWFVVPAGFFERSNSVIPGACPIIIPHFFIENLPRDGSQGG
jgi:hypothetical protein